MGNEKRTIEGEKICLSHTHTQTQFWHNSLCVIDSFISSAQYANALLLAGAPSYCTPPLLPQRSRARWELAKWYSCLFRCVVREAQQTQDLLLQLQDVRLWV